MAARSPSSMPSSARLKAAARYYWTSNGSRSGSSRVRSFYTTFHASLLPLLSLLTPYHADLTVKMVHKDLDLVGWYTILPPTGPQAHHVPIHQQFLQYTNESALLLGFHPSAMLDTSNSGGSLPLSIYDSNYEAADTNSGTSEAMAVDDAAPQLVLRFLELPYVVETGEAEMIGVDFVARGGGNATAVDTGSGKKTGSETAAGKGKAVVRKKVGQEADVSRGDAGHVLSREDEELIASLTAKANAIRMLHSRITLLTTYLEQLPTSDSDATSNTSASAPSNHTVLRSIAALLARLTLLIPADSTAFNHELLASQNDVNLVTLLSELTQSVRDVRGVGQKFHVVHRATHKRSAAAATNEREQWQTPAGYEMSGNVSGGLGGMGGMGGANDGADFNLI